MELFKTNKLIFTLLFIHPIDKDVKLAWKLLIIFCGLFIFGSTTFFLIGSTFYLIRHVNDLAEILYTIAEVCAFVCVDLSFAIGIVNRNKYVALVKRMQDIYDSSKKLK